ncbi:MAG: helix-turn-helix domain-containing protein, partial [Syntrophales bacterium]
AGQVLNAVADAKEPIGPSEIARESGVSVDTAFRMCATLEELGFLQQIGDRYQLGMGLALFWARKKASLEGEKSRVERDLDSLEV